MFSLDLSFCIIHNYPIATALPCWASKLSSAKLQEFQEDGLPGFGYRIGRRKINNDVESVLDTFEQNYEQQKGYYSKLVTSSKLTGGVSNPIIAESVSALKQQRNNLLDAKDLYESTVFESRGEGGVFTSKGRSQNTLARLDAQVGLIDNIITQIENILNYFIVKNIFSEIYFNNYVNI